MNRSLALRYLCWKEVRQVLPLVWMQLGLGLCFQLLFLLHPNRMFVPRFLVFAGMPTLFAVGAGVLLVGQEKERRTLDWLRSLPIAARDLVAVKLATGLFALIAVWCLNLLLLAIFVLPTGRWPVASPADSWLIDAGWEYLWPLQSVFLLLAGFATAWVFRSSLVALLALLPLALLPGVVTSGLNHLVRWPGGVSLTLSDPAPWMTALALIALSPLLLVVGWRRGMKYLAPEQVFQRRIVSTRSQADSRDEPDIWTRPAHTPGAMLIWQFVGQNKTVLKGIAAMLLVAVGLLVTTPTLGSGRPVLAAFCALLAASWLGVLAFQGDGLQDRIRFLAERGISPAKIWWTRHVPALSLLAMALALTVLVLPAELRRTHLSALGLLCVVAAILFTYTVSQAVGQVFRSSTIAAVAAPVVTWGLAAYGGSLIALLGVPYWLLAGCALLPWLATFLLMRRWMDGRLGWGFWAAHAGFLAIGLVLPLVPAGLVLVSRPTMPADVRQQLTVESQGYGTSYAEPRELVLRFRSPEAIDVPPANRRAEGRIACEQLEHDLSLAPGPIRFVPRVLVYLLGEARLARMALEQDADLESNRERYRRTLALIGTLVERMRLSWRLVDQDGADLVEIWLVNELGATQAESRLGPEVYGRLVRAVSDDTGRDAARRRAVVMSWAAHRKQSHAPEALIGGYAWRGDETSILFRVNPFLRRRAADYLTWRMLERLERSEPAKSVERTKELARYWGVPELHYGLVPGGEYLRANKPADFALPVEGFFRSAPGSQWHAGWERAARELADNLDGQGEVANP
jgi:hypothetical protein